MDNIYALIIITLSLLAIGDLIVGVSNDAVNFLNSAIGSKVFTFRNIMIFASLGIACGAFFSSGMMEVARKGIFNPEVFFFDEIIYIFMAVMVTDILLLDFFNTLGMPTSTTVSIVFELLGAAVVMALIKIFDNGESLSDLPNYINTAKAVQIILGILLSVGIAFTIGAVVQWISRVLLTYRFDEKPAAFNAFFGALSLAAICNFILIKGLKGTAFASTAFGSLGGLTLNEFLESQVLLVNLLNVGFWFVIALVLMRAFALDMYKLIIAIGTFALALAFAGNDLVNFIGVPIAAYQSYLAWVDSGVAAEAFGMGVLQKKVATPTVFLLASGIIMILTLWFSSKARRVVKTSIDLSDQNNTRERFRPNFLARSMVRLFSNTNAFFVRNIPEKSRQAINEAFAFEAVIDLSDKDRPAFDRLRACINLVVAAVLISIATSLKLPLSTTYVTFMVAMGTSLADRAWGTDSAVYRVAGVLNVIGGWFFTAISAFVVCGSILYLINLGGPVTIAIIVFIILVIIGRNFIKSNKSAQIARKRFQVKSESKSLQGVIQESGDNITVIFEQSISLYREMIEGLAADDFKRLLRNRRNAEDLKLAVEELRNSLFFFIKSLEDTSFIASNYYINLLGLLHDLAEDIQYMTKISHRHSYNNHKKISDFQHDDLLTLLFQLEFVFSISIEAFHERFSTEEFEKVVNQKQATYDLIQDKIERQIVRTREAGTSSKNTVLYFNLLTRTKDLIQHKFEIVEEFYELIQVGKR